jgi:hypothetical protein
MADAELNRSGVEIFPAMASRSIVGCCIADAKFMGKSENRGVFQRITAAYLQYLNLGQPRSSMSLAHRIPTLCDCIRHILIMCSDEQMRAVAARRVIAVVTHIQAIGHRFIRMGQIPCDLMSASNLSVSSGEGTVTIGICSCQPRPAGVRPTRLIHLGPEANSKRNFKTSAFADAGTEPCSPMFDFVPPSKECRTAGFTDPENGSRLNGHRNLQRCGVVPPAGPSARGHHHVSILSGYEHG